MDATRGVIAACGAALLAMSGCAGEPQSGSGEQAGKTGPFIELRLVSETPAAGLEQHRCRNHSPVDQHSAAAIDSVWADGTNEQR